MSIDKSVKFNGQTVFWSLRNGTHLSKLKEGFESIGRGDLLPEVQNDSQVLKRAISKNFPGRNKVIRPLKGVAGFAILDETEVLDSAGQKDLDLSTELRIAISGNVILANPSDHPKVSAIGMDYLYEKDRITAAKLGGVLVTACSQLSGIPLRPRGGFYWMPNSSVDEWEEVVNVVEQANPQNSIWRMKTTTDEDTVDAVCDSLIIEVEKQLEVLSESLHSEELGKRALKTKQNTAIELKGLVSRYEGILGKTLKSLKEKADEVHSSASVALLQCL